MHENEYAGAFLAVTAEALRSVSEAEVEQIARALLVVRESGGRLFVAGSGGSAANASHAVADFRKLCGIECYSPSDNVAELTARTNDDGWRSAYSGWLQVSRIGPADALLVFSVGGGDLDMGLSPNLVDAIDLANAVGALVVAVVGREGGHAHQKARHVIVAGGSDPGLLTPVAETVQAAIWHLLATHPLLRVAEPVWEAALAAEPA